MALRLIVYASTSSIPPAFAEREIAGIVTQSQRRNEEERVTGALLYSEHNRFAQVLEGEDAAVGAIMDSIRLDRRHSNIVLLHDGPIGDRRFSGWSLVYRGYTPRIEYVIRHAEYGAKLSSDGALRELLGVMAHLAAGQALP